MSKMTLKSRALISLIEQKRLDESRDWIEENSRIIPRRAWNDRYPGLQPFDEENSLFSQAPQLLLFNTIGLTLILALSSVTILFPTAVCLQG